MGLFSSILVNSSTVANLQNMSFLERISPPVDISAEGHLIDYLFHYTTYLNLFFFTLVCIGLFGFSYLYSAKRNQKPYYTYGNKKSHILVATLIGASVFITIDLNITRMANNDFVNVFANFPKGDEVVKIEIMAQQWMWNIRYAGADGEFNTADDITTTNDLRLPIGKKVVVQLISKDVIHSFFLPNVRRKVDAMPGRISRMWFELKQTGSFEIACAEMCGTHHYKMRGQMIAQSQEEFQNWLGEAQKIAYSANDVQNLDSFWGWKWEN